MNKILLSKLLNYENEIFNRFIKKRTDLLNRLNQINQLNKSQSINFINSFKSIIESIKSTDELIDIFFVNDHNNFNESRIDNLDKDFILFYFCFKDIFFSKINGYDLSESSETSEIPESSESSDASESSELSSVV